MIRTGFYPGSFDPLTNGHVDIIARAARLADRLVIGVGLHHGKTPLFSDAERVAMLKAAIPAIARDAGAEIMVETFDDLAVDAARRFGANVIFRGLRNADDYDYEMQMAGMNTTMAPDIEVAFLAASPQTRHIAATFVRQIAAMGGDVSPFVPPAVLAELKKKF